MHNTPFGKRRFPILLAGLAATLLTFSTALIAQAEHVQKVLDLPAGSDVESPLVVDQDGTMYGTSRAGGANSLGSVFSVTTSGSFHTIYSFTGAADGSDPRSGLTLTGTAGVFYGTTAEGGTNGFGTLFLLSGTSLGTLHTFAGAPGDGANPLTALTLRNGLLYGAASTGGTAGNGIIFTIQPGGTDFTIIRNFAQYAPIFRPSGDLTVDGTNLYGACSGGTGDQDGGLYLLDGTDGYQEVMSGGHHSGIQYPNGGPLSVSGTLYGTCSGGTVGGIPLGSIYEHVGLPNYEFLLLRLYGGEPFGGGPIVVPHYPYDGIFSQGTFGQITDTIGTTPLAPLTDAGNQDLLGSNAAGGGNGAGTLFREDITLASGSLIPSLFSYGNFFSFGGDMGSTPVAAMVTGTDGSFYGSTSAGGSNGGGTIYRVLPNRRPVAPNLQFVVQQPTTVDMLQGAWDPDGDTLTFVVMLAPGGDPLNFEGLYTYTSPDGVLTLTPSDNHGGTTYAVSDGMDVAVGTVTLLSGSSGLRQSTYTGPILDGTSQVGVMQLTTTSTNATRNKQSVNITALTGSVVIGGTHSAFTAKIPATPVSPFTVTTVKVTTGGWSITLTSGNNLDWIATIDGHHKKLTASIEPLTEDGVVNQSYTAVITSSAAAHGFALFQRDSVHTVRVIGRLPDSTPFTGSAGIGDGEGAIAGIFGGTTLNGSTGSLSIAPISGPDLTGTFTVASAEPFTAYPFTAPTGNQSVFDLSAGHTCHFTFTRADGTSFPLKVHLTSANASTGNPKISFSVNRSTGLLTGKVLDPQKSKPIQIQGAVLQPLNGAAGVETTGTEGLTFTMTVGS